MANKKQPRKLISAVRAVSDAMIDGADAGTNKPQAREAVRTSLDQIFDGGIQSEDDVVLSADELGIDADNSRRAQKAKKVQTAVRRVLLAVKSAPEGMAAETKELAIAALDEARD